MLFSQAKRRGSTITSSLVSIYSVYLTLQTSTLVADDINLTLRSGMENLQQVAKLVLAIVRLSFSTPVKLVLSSGTEINHKSVMTLHMETSIQNPPHNNRSWH